MVEEAEFAEVERLPELHTKLNTMIEVKLGPRSLEILRLNVPLIKHRLQRLAGLRE